jgi:isoquinoline 1-oxidoreductase subunit alpha
MLTRSRQWRHFDDNTYVARVSLPTRDRANATQRATFTHHEVKALAPADAFTKRLHASLVIARRNGTPRAFGWFLIRRGQFMPIEFTLNGKPQAVDVPPQMPLLWVLRDTLGLTGTKFGCGVALCGACTVHLDGRAVRSCQTAVQAVAGKKVTTVEGLSADGTHPVQRAWIEEDVPQCGYCQSGQMMSAAALLTTTASPSDLEIDRAMRGNICRCGTYSDIRRAIHRAAGLMKGA